MIFFAGLICGIIVTYAICRISFEMERNKEWLTKQSTSTKE